MANSTKTINASLWVLQTLVATMFVVTGFMKIFQPIEPLSAMLPWTGQVSPFMVRGLGIIDLLGGIGIFLPSLIRIKPQLTVTAAIANIFLMIGAIVFHIARGEASVIGFNIILIFILAFIAWGRSKKLAIQPK